MWLEFKRFIIPCLIAVGQLLTTALSIGLLPALWILLRGHRWRTFLKWGFVAVVCITAAVYALPLAYSVWKENTLKMNAFRVTGVLVGYGVSALFAPMIIPEPLRMARRLLRKDPSEEKKGRRRRRKRRSKQLPGELKIR